jgi:putative NADPH-quinone reductase
VPQTVAIIEGHPDGSAERLNRTLADAYARGATNAGHAVERIRLAEMDFPWLRTADDFLHGEPPHAIAGAQAQIKQANHLAIFYPLWLGTMPALLKAFIEQTFRPGFAFNYGDKGWPKTELGGRSARIVVTMGMPALAYRWFFRAHSLKSLERNVLKFVGIKPVRDTVIGGVEGADEAKRATWIAKMERLGARGR